MKSECDCVCVCIGSTESAVTEKLLASLSRKGVNVDVDVNANSERKVYGVLRVHVI
ncbi:uncharacterized protein Dvir_GJ26619, isoform A [Drosophila virilis]|uniref:Uncharacterized protein, isoform A n=1 Tax=Drosophila virilis TaxID=7244 RepID=A0A0Q9WF65_DROVI|nr:uncharacterized protein Dvir_GJ26619, isoform A [Drosophila virilis]